MSFAKEGKVLTSVRTLALALYPFQDQIDVALQHVRLIAHLSQIQRIRFLYETHKLPSVSSSYQRTPPILIDLINIDCSMRPPWLIDLLPTLFTSYPAFPRGICSIKRKYLLEVIQTAHKSQVACYKLKNRRFMRFFTFHLLL